MQNGFDLLQRQIWLGPLILVFAILLGLGLGLLIGWVIAPVSWTLTADDVQAIADSYALNNDLNLARTRLQNLSAADQVRIFKKLIADSTARNRPIETERVTTLAQALRLPMDGAPVPASPSPAPAFSISSLMPVLLVGAILFASLLIVVGGFLFLRVVLPKIRSRQQTAAMGMMEEPVQAEEFEPPAPSAGSLGRHLATYNAGMDNFDISYPLETPRQGFMGECGIGVSETIGDGLPDKVTAFDLWLFDKTDVRTVTQILMSEFAYNDPGLRAKLLTKGDAALASKDRVLTLETQSLRIKARIQEMAYATNPSLPPNSYFQKLVVEIASYLK